MPGNGADSQEERAALTPELVRQVAERVYALWLRDLATLRERSPARTRPRTGRLRRRR